MKFSFSGNQDIYLEIAERYKEKTVAGFSIGVYGKQTQVTATITGQNTVVIDVPAGVSPTTVNYAYFLTVTPENATLRSGLGLPAPAFSLEIE